MEHRACSLLAHHIVLRFPIYLFVLDTGLKALCRLYCIHVGSHLLAHSLAHGK